MTPTRHVYDDTDDPKAPTRHVYKDTDDPYDDGNDVTQQHHARDEEGDGKQNDPWESCRGNADAEEDSLLHAGADGDHAQQSQGDRHKP